MTLEQIGDMIGKPVVYCPVGEGMTEGGILVGGTDSTALVNFRGIVRNCEPEDLFKPSDAQLKCRQCRQTVVCHEETGTFMHADVADSIFCGLLPLMES